MFFKKTSMIFYSNRTIAPRASMIQPILLFFLFHKLNCPIIIAHEKKECMNTPENGSRATE